MRRPDSYFNGKRLRGPYMNLHVGTIASLFALILIHAGIGKADTSLSQQNPKGDVITQEEALIAATLNDIANVETQFAKTKDSASVLRFYTEDYAGIKDGKSETVKDQEKYLAEILGRINLGEPIGISSKFMNIKPSVAGSLGWATYEYEYKIVRSGVLQRFSQGQCTTIFRKQGDSWLIRHEHCSTVSPIPFFLNPR
jgi:ketosteroid isomerase-like protein